MTQSRVMGSPCPAPTAEKRSAKTVVTRKEFATDAKNHGPNESKPMEDIYDGYSDVTGKATDQPSRKSCGKAWTEHAGCQRLCAHAKKLEEAIAFGGFEIGRCDDCGITVVYLADGLPAYCMGCINKVGA